MKKWTVQDVMTRDVITVRGEATYREVVDTLASRGVSAVPVIDDLGRVLGVVSEADLLRKLEFIGHDAEPRLFEWRTRKRDRAKANAGTAAELMSQPAVTVQPGTSLTAAAKLLDIEHVKRLPVVDEIGHLVGIVSRADLLSVYLRPDDAIRRDIVDNVLPKLLWLDPLNVEAQVDKGIVTLTGEVGQKSAASVVAYVVGAVPGVIQVMNHLTFSYDDTAVPTVVGT